MDLRACSFGSRAKSEPWLPRPRALACSRAEGRHGGDTRHRGCGRHLRRRGLAPVPRLSVRRNARGGRGDDSGRDAADEEVRATPQRHRLAPEADIRVLDVQGAPHARRLRGRALPSCWLAGDRRQGGDAWPHVKWLPCRSTPCCKARWRGYKRVRSTCSRWTFRAPTWTHLGCMTSKASLPGRRARATRQRSSSTSTPGASAAHSLAAWALCVVHRCAKCPASLGAQRQGWRMSAKAGASTAQDM